MFIFDSRKLFFLKFIPIKLFTFSASGHLPDGMFKSDTIIQFCCMDQPLDNPSDGITLPRDTPFYLFPFKSRVCQHVIGTKVHLEFIQFDLENDYGWMAELTAFEEPTAYAEITSKEKHLKLYYCYYEPGEEIVTTLCYLRDISVILIGPVCRCHSSFQKRNHENFVHHVVKLEK